MWGISVGREPQGRRTKIAGRDDAADVVEEYIYACVEKQIYEVRIIHGKGKGVLRRVVHSILEKHPLVADFSLDSGASGWGATIAYLKKEG